MAAITRLGPVAQPLKALIRSNRAFGSADAVQYHYDDDFEEEEYDVCMAGAMLERGVKYVMIGEAGVRRKLFAERLSKLLQVPHISMATSNLASLFIKGYSHAC